MKKYIEQTMRKTRVFCLTLALAGIGIQSCTYDFGMDSISIEQTARLELSLEDFLDFLDHYYDYETHLRINAIYGGSFKPLVDLSSPSLRGTTIDAKTAVSSLLNKNRVFQVENRVIFVSEDFRVIKAINATNYDTFLESRPRNTLDIPENIMVGKIILLSDSDSSTRGLGVGRRIDCFICGIRIITLLCKVPQPPSSVAVSCMLCISYLLYSGTVALAPNYNDCSAYYVCDNGVLFAMSCPDGLYFCYEKGTCSWSWDPECKFNCVARR